MTGIKLSIFEFIDKIDLPPLVIFVVLFIPILPNLWSIIHAYRSKFDNSVEKMAWIIVNIFFPIIGGLIYIFWGTKRSYPKN